MSSQNPPPPAAAQGSATTPSGRQGLASPRQQALAAHIAPTVGLAVAQNDMHNFLAQSHGAVFDMAMKYAESIGIQRDQVSYIAMALAAVYLIFGSAARLLCNFIGFGYPTYASVKAIRTKETDDDTTWLIYWTCFAVLYLVDFFSEAILSFFPFYYILKACFLVYLYLPQTRGSIMFYDTVVDPLVVFVDQAIDKYYYQKQQKAQ